MIPSVLLLLIMADLTVHANVVDFSENYPTWEEYKIMFHKNYASNEESKRKQTYLENLVQMRIYNKAATLGLHSHYLGVTHFADMTSREFQQITKSKMTKPRKTTNLKKNTSVLPEKFNLTVNLTTLPTEVDWRKKNVVSPVISQKGCGSCWAISAAGSMEGIWAIKIGHLVPLSTQNLLDCVDKDGNSGCDGGNIEAAFEYVVQNKGIDNEDCYPYLAKAVALHGPVAASINTESVDLQHYKRGIYNNPHCKKNPTHGVLVVGYGTNENGVDYWIVKNSWGEKWGENGYFRIARNGNICGICNMASFPVV